MRSTLFFLEFKTIFLSVSYINVCFLFLEPSHRAAHALKGVVDKFKIKSVHFELCDEPYGKLRDSEVVKLCKQDNVAFKRWSGATLVGKQFSIFS